MPASSIGSMFWQTATAHASRLALSLKGTSYTNAELADRSARIAALLGDAPPLGAVLAALSLTAYSGVLGTLLAGAGWVPLDPKFPVDRTAQVLDISGARTLVVDAESVGLLEGVLAPIDRSLTVVLPDVGDVSVLAARWPRHRFFGADALTTAPLSAPRAVDSSSLAYLLFTSGSTGAPKGVMVTQANVLHHVEAMSERYAIDEHDRFSQTFDLTFGPSAFDMFVCWGRRASLHCLPAAQVLFRDAFIAEHALTVWFSVPSVAFGPRKLGWLTPGEFPSLRWSLFCGERLPAEIAQAWQSAASSSVVENLYGPTEVTIACTLYRRNPVRSPAQCHAGVVPIGREYPGMSAAVVDASLARVAPAERGELCMRGPQVSAGYWRDAEQTTAAFVAMPLDEGPENRWYRTGDIAFVDACGDIIHCGRDDAQVKVRGCRVELGGVEHVLRESAGTSAAVVLPFPTDGPSVLGLTATCRVPCPTRRPSSRACARGCLPAWYRTSSTSETSYRSTTTARSIGSGGLPSSRLLDAGAI